MFTNNNPINFIDPDGRAAISINKPDDWVEDIDGNITWRDDVTSATDSDLKAGETYLGKNVLVGTHNRDASGNEEINSATFELYLESDKTGPTATISGNTVPADTDEYGTVAEGLYSAKYSRYNGEGALLIEGGGALPTVSGNPNNPANYNADGTLKPVGEHIITEVFFHVGNFARPSLSTFSGSPISAGCQTGPHGRGSLSKYRSFIKNARGFKGNYYLRSKPQTRIPRSVPFSTDLLGVPSR